MDKILSDGTVLTKAKFWRTTCKSCRKEMPKSIIMSGGNFCNKSCRASFNPRKPKRLYPVIDEDAEESHCDMVEQNY